MKPQTNSRHLAELLTLTQRWLDDYPDLNLAARAEAQRLLTLHGLQAIAPEELHWHLFDNAQSSATAFSGWSHSGPPRQSLTLPQLVLERFAPADQDRLDQLNMMGGFYTQGGEATRYGAHNEARLLPSQLSADFWRADFATRYRARLKGFWDTRASDFIALSRASALVAISQAYQRGMIDAAQQATLRQALANGLADDVSMTALARKRPVPAGLKVTGLSILKARARDLLCVWQPDGAVYLYLPNSTDGVRCFEDGAALQDWLGQRAATKEGLAELRAHFDPGDETARHVLMQLGEHTLAPAWLGGEALPPGQDPFAWLAEQAAAEMDRHAELALTSNNRLRKEAAIAFLSTLAELAAKLAPIDWPIALGAVASASLAMGLDIDKAIHARSAEERKAAIGAAIGEGLTALFTLPLLAAGKVSDWPWEVLEDEPLVLPRLPALPASPVSRWPLNTRGMIEQTDHELLFAVEEVARKGSGSRGAPGLAVTQRFDRLPRMIDGPCLRVFGNAEGALGFAKAHFDGPFNLFRIQARGLRVVSLRHNLRFNRINTLALLGQDDRLLAPEELASFADGAWLEHEAHIPLNGLAPARLRLLSPVEREPWNPIATRVLRGVRCQRLNPGVAPSYLISVGDSLRLVRFDPLSSGWRTATGEALRYDEATGEFRPYDPLRAAQAPATEIEASTAELGMPATYPWLIPPALTEGRLPIPRAIHSVWLGKRLPQGFVENVFTNARRAGAGDKPFDYHLYLGVEAPLDQSLTLADLASAPSNLHIHLLEDTAFFRVFQGSPYYEHYLAATQGSGINYASAVDVLRYRLLHFYGGVYMDIDDVIHPSAVIGDDFGDLDWSVSPGQLMLNGLVNESRLGLRCEFNTSNFAALPGTPVLEEISMESRQRFLANRDLYFQRPYERVDSAEAVTAYARRINHVTGPRVFNDVLAQRVPALGQFRAVTRIATELYVAPRQLAELYRQLREHTRAYCPLAWRIKIGSTASWLHTR